MKPSTNPFCPPISDFSTLKPGDKVWIVFETFKPGLSIPVQRRFAYLLTGLPMLSLDSSLCGAMAHHGPIWTRRSGALEELVEMARRRADAANAEVARLEEEWGNCED